MYIWTILGSGGFGQGLLFGPEAVRAAMGGYAPQDPVLLGIVGTVGVAFAALSVLGCLSPL
jgi:hypothetical protein